MPIATISRERIEQINGRLLNGGAIGFLKGTIIAIVSGTFFSYRYNHGHNKRFFSPQCRAGYFIAWGIAGISFAVENAKINVAEDLAEEENLKRKMFFEEKLKHE